MQAPEMSLLSVEPVIDEHWCWKVVAVTPSQSRVVVSMDEDATFDRLAAALADSQGC